ncbi:TetR/AcrR family transcriptional regulator [Microbacteriaceae bacterium K1510]|nr:TetR/AcrR family transcriptional regulator [Microbacteriaceae bacterium K1510]
MMKSPKAKPADKPAKPKKSELRREAILRHALALFDLHGFANTSLDDIARETGIKREAIYYYFKDRAEILLCIIRPQTRSLVDGLEAVVKSDVDSTTKLYEAIRNHLQRFDRHCLEMTISLRDVYLDDAKEVRREMDKIWRQYESMWTQIVAEGQASGQFAEVGDPKMVAFAILGMCNWLARWYDPRKSVSVEELIETYFSMLAYGLVKKRDAKAVGHTSPVAKRSKAAARPRLTVAGGRDDVTPR